jgi:hypothetical protein
VAEDDSTVALSEHLPTAPPSLARRRGESDVTLSVFLVLLVASTVMAWPLRDAGLGWAVTALRLVTILVGVAAIASDRSYAVGAALTAVAVGYGHLASDERGPLLLAARLAFFAFVAAALLVRVFRRGRVTVHRLFGAVAVYVLLAVAWGTAYDLLLVLRPDAIRGASGPASLDEAMWLSFITLTTTGYGDILPASPLARSLAALEAMVGVLYPAILISRLVSLVQGQADGDAP